MDEKDCPNVATETPLTRLFHQIKHLDESLVTIKGHSPESEKVRLYIIGQIEALDYAIRMFDV